MRLCVNLDTFQFQTSPGNDFDVPTFDFVYGNPFPIELIFSSGLIQCDLPSGFSPLGVALRASLGTSTCLAWLDSFAKSGAGPTTIYTGNLSLATIPLQSAFSGAGQPPQISAFLGVQWTNGTVTVGTPPIGITIENNLTSGSAVDPVSVGTITDDITGIQYRPGMHNGSPTWVPISS